MNHITTLLQNLKNEEKNTEEILHITANENRMSKTARKFLSSNLSERYYFGGGSNGIVDFNPFMIRGLPAVEDIVTTAEQELIKMTGAKAVNLNPLSGIHAMVSVIATATSVGERVMTIHPDKGGHFATNRILADLGRECIYAPYDASKDNNIADIISFIRKNHIGCFYIDLMNYIHKIDIHSIKKEFGDSIKIIYDASHTLGLIMCNQFQSPINEGADIICSNTHKTFPGPHKGLVLFKDQDYGEKINAKIAGTHYSSVHTNALISLCISILEMSYYGEKYVEQILQNTKSLARAFEELGYSVRKIKGEYSQNHQVHLFLPNNLNRQQAYKSLLVNNISTNINALSDEKLFLRLGTQEITRRGMKEQDMYVISGLIHFALCGKDVRQEVIHFNNKFKNVIYSFDN